MRPRGEIRQALEQSAWALARERNEGVTWREIAAHAQVGWKPAFNTVREMVRAGDLQPVGTVRLQGVCRPLTAYRPSDEVSRAADGGQLTVRTVELTNAINTWASFV